MKKRIAYLLTGMLAVAASGCTQTAPGTGSPSSTGGSAAQSPGDSGKLTQAKAQAALDKFRNTPSKSGVSQGQITVIGVQEMPQQNAASADLRYSNVKFEKWHGFYQKMLQYEWSGAGTASFKHYSDGRWVLDSIRIPLDLGMGWDNINIEVR